MMFRSHCVEAHLSLPYYRLVVEYYYELLRSQKKSNIKFIQVNLLYTYRDCIWNNVRNTTGKRQPWDLIFQYGVTINYEFLWMLTNQPHKSFKMAAAIQPSLKNSRNALFALHVWLSVYVWTSIGIFNK